MKSKYEALEVCNIDRVKNLARFVAVVTKLQFSLQNDYPKRLAMRLLKREEFTSKSAEVNELLT